MRAAPALDSIRILAKIAWDLRQTVAGDDADDNDARYSVAVVAAALVGKEMHGCP